jgi:acyl dehydratase
MTFDHNRLMNWPFRDVVRQYDDKDTILYALSVGVGADPIDPRQLRFVYEQDLQAFPTMPIVLGMTDMDFLTDPAIGIDLPKMLHGESGLTIHAPLAPVGTIISRMRFVDLVDKGAGKGSLLFFERSIRDAGSGNPLATERGCFVLRGNGGFSAEARKTPAPRAIPDRAPDEVCTLPTLPQSGLLYRLTGDRNPLHVDPAVAKSAGFDRPILHGSCAYGIAGHALLKVLCNYDAKRFRRMDVRFTAPVLPGDTLQTEVWLERQGTALFRCKVLERNRVVIDNGFAEYETATPIGPSRSASH